MAAFWLFTPCIVRVRLDFLVIICVKYVCNCRCLVMSFLLHSERQVFTAGRWSLKVLKLWGPLVLSENNRTKQSKETCIVVSQTEHFMINVTICFCLRGFRSEVWTSLSLRILVFWVIRLLSGLIDSRLFDVSYRRFLPFSASQNSRTRQSHSCYCIRYWYWYFSLQESWWVWTTSLLN